MTKLNQLIAVSKGVRSAATAGLTDAHRQSQKAPLLSGLIRTYQPKDDEGERLPGESTKVQYTAQQAIEAARGVMARMFDVTASLDATNQTATADVKVDGRVVIAQAPVTFLLTLEKHLVDLRTFIAKLPQLDPAVDWGFDEVAGFYRSAPVQTVRTTKIPRNHVLAPATDKHPAQVQMFSEDVVVGTWTTVRLSGALPATEISEMLGRVDALLQAVKMAREEANATEVVDRKVGADILSYVFG